ncbi:hypothetical protein PVAG01_06638 [Phlyctema vagabunda]|uniref:Uncharacterized protein n=1 Tax=Phlyctema vagabunda TaxID=108571 RepID=A0ABR4PHA3_9HELO
MAPSLAEIAVNGRKDGHPSPRTARSPSISSDRPSMSGYGGLLSPPMTASPDPVYIAASAASQIVTNDHDSRAESWFDQLGIEPSGETALVAPAALKLVNKFLDQLLFNFLSVSRSTSLASLRPAVSEVLKPKLAKDAISGADQELHEYLGGGEDEELLAFHNGTEPNGDWDLELIWKRTRLRCMVYSSLGDMEEEDEDYYTEQEHLEGPTGLNARLSNNAGVVSPAVAIFLTSILEFMGEQALVIAGHAAYYRLRAKHEKEERDGLHTPAEVAERVVVDEADMERVALDRTLGRLWRGWKKRIRSPTVSVSMTRSFSRESLNSMVHNSRSASATPLERNIYEDPTEPVTQRLLTEDEKAAMIALPMEDEYEDVREIEIPGLAFQSDDEEDLDEQIQLPVRPKSLMVLKDSIPGPPAVTASQSQSQSPELSFPKIRKRSNSLPSSGHPPHTSPIKHDATNEVSPERQVPTIKIPKKQNKPEGLGIVGGFMAGAAAVGGATLAGVIAAANGEAPKTEITDKDENDTEEDFTEDVQILTSARVSIHGGRVSPSDTTEPSRRSSIRSPSVHSVRMIDVSSPRSPSISRQNSGDANDYISSGRAVPLSRPNSIHSPILVDTSITRGTSPILRSQTTSPIVRNGSALSSRQARNSAEEPISEVEEKDIAEADSAPITAVPSELVATTQGANPAINQQCQTAQTASIDVAPKPATFVLAAAPPPRSSAREYSRPAAMDYRATQTGTVAITQLRSTAGSEPGAPPLTPLSELMEGAAESFDGGSSKPPRAPAANAPRKSSISAAARPATEPRPGPQPISHNSGSSISSTSTNKLKPVRTSEDIGRPQDRGRSFDDLIRSDQTIQYTLTPQSMRNVQGGPQGASKASEVQRPSTSRSHSSSLTRLTGLNSNPPVTDKQLPRPATSGTSRLRSNAPQARDARVDRDSIGDFAEFIRSTGPPGSYNERKPSGSASAVNGHRGANGIPRQASGSAPRVSAATALPRRAESSAGRSRLQARAAVVANNDTSSDLIDFIRQGPPSMGQDDHRIPRTVAPFRSTMDSDQMVGAVGGKAVDASLPGPQHNEVSIIDPSIQSKTSSVTSQSALLNHKNSKPLPNYNMDDFEEEDMIPKRKTRRVKDPYAIDFSDEEDELDFATARTPKPVKEESLADFLRNVPPPPANDPPALKPLSQKDIKKKASAPSLMSRFGRGIAPALPPKAQSTKAQSAQGDSNSSSSRSTGSAPRAGHVPIAAQFTSPATNTYQPTRPSDDYVSQLGTARAPSRGPGRVAQRNFQAREPTSFPVTGTSDLADFLRSDPPPGMNGPSSIHNKPQKEEPSGFSRMFGRRRKAVT